MDNLPASTQSNQNFGGLINTDFPPLTANPQDGQSGSPLIGQGAAIVPPSPLSSLSMPSATAAGVGEGLPYPTPSMDYASPMPALQGPLATIATPFLNPPGPTLPYPTRSMEAFGGLPMPGRVVDPGALALPAVQASSPPEPGIMLQTDAGDRRLHPAFPDAWYVLKVREAANLIPEYAPDNMSREYSDGLHGVLNRHGINMHQDGSEGRFGRMGPDTLAQIAGDLSQVPGTLPEKAFMQGYIVVGHEATMGTMATLGLPDQRPDVTHLTPSDHTRHQSFEGRPEAPPASSPYTYPVWDQLVRHEMGRLSTLADAGADLAGTQAVADRIGRLQGLTEAAPSGPNSRLASGLRTILDQYGVGPGVNASQAVAAMAPRKLSHLVYEIGTGLGDASYWAPSPSHSQASTPTNSMVQDHRQSQGFRVTM